MLSSTCTVLYTKYCAGNAVLCEGVYLPVESTRRVPVDPAVVSSGVLPMVSVGGVTLTYDHLVKQDSCAQTVFPIKDGAAMVLVPWHIHPTTRLGCCGG